MQRPCCQRFDPFLSPVLNVDYFFSSVPQRLCRPPGVCTRSLTFQLALQLETVAFSPDVQNAPRPLSPRCHAPTCAHESHAEDANSFGTSPTINIAEYGVRRTGRAVTCDGRGASQGRAGSGLRITRGRARTFDNKPFVIRPHLEDFSLAHTSNGNAWWRQFGRAQGGGKEGRGPNEYGKQALRRVEASVNAGHSRGGNRSSSPTPHGRLVDAGSMQSVPSNATDVPAKRFGNEDMVMLATLLAHPESLLKVSGGLVLDCTPAFVGFHLQKGHVTAACVCGAFSVRPKTPSKSTVTRVAG